MTHLWVRAESRAHEERVGITPEGAADLIAAGFQVTVEESPHRCIPLDAYIAGGCATAAEGSWPAAPSGAIIFGLKELPADGTPLPHRHIMFGHAFKGQEAGRVLLDRFKAGGGTLYDLEYLIDADGRRVAAFGYWAGYAGAAVALLCWIAQQKRQLAGPVTTFAGADTMRDHLRDKMGDNRPNALIIGALGRVGTGAGDLYAQLNIPVTKWDIAETASGGPFPEILDHAIFLNCILARSGTPVFVPQSAKTAPRKLSVIGDIACDPQSDFSPIKVYSHETTWDAPVIRVHDSPPLDVTAIDNLPSMLPRESSADYAQQLLPYLRTLDAIDTGVWGRAEATFKQHL